MADEGKPGQASLPPPPEGCNWKLLTTADGHPFYLTWPLGKTLAEAGAPLLVGLMEMNERAQEHSQIAMEVVSE